MNKKLQKVIFSLLSIFLFVQVSGVGTLFAQDLKEEIIEVQDTQEEVDLDEEIIANEPEEEKDEQPRSESEIALGDFKLTFKDYTGAHTPNAYIRTGTGTTGIITFNLAGQEGVEANTLAFRLKFPKGSDVRMTDNTSYALTIGSENNPLGTPLPDDPYTYVWFTLKTHLNSAQTETINFEHNPKLKPGQIGTDDVVINIEMDAFELKTNEVSQLQNHTSASMISYGDVFAFNAVSSSYNYYNQNVTTKTEGTLSTITFNQSVSHRHGAGTAGLVDTLKVIYTNKFEVDKNSSNNPYIKFTRNDIVKPNGDAFANTELSVTTNNAGYVTSFTIITEAVAPAGQQISSTQAGFKITSPSLDKDLVQSDFNLAIGASKKVEIKNVETSARAIPVSKVSGLANNRLDLTVSTVGVTGATYTNASETGTESYDQTFSKRLYSLANVSTVGANMDRLAAYKNDIAVYDFGQGWNNKQEENISRLEFIEYADDQNGRGYKSNEILPLRIQTGVVTVGGKNLADATVGLDVIVEYTDGTPNFITHLNADELDVSQTIKIPVDKQEHIKLIKFVYTNVDPRFTISSAPKIEFRVVGGDATKQGIKITNTAALKYTYKTRSFDKDSNEVYFRFRDVEVDKDGIYKSNKSGLNLSRDEFHIKDDVILFSIDIENRKNNDVSIQTIEDEFTYNLSPYDGLHSINNDPSSPLIDRKYIARDDNDDLLNPTNITNLVAWKYVTDPLDPTKDPVLERMADQSIIDSVVIQESTTTEYSRMTVNFANAGVTLEPGEKIVLTYTMNTNDRFETDATIGNRFEALEADSTLIGKGEYWKSKPNDTNTDPSLSSSYNKLGVNANGTTLSERPFVDDVVIYTLVLDNKLGEDWENIVITDTFSSNLSIYNSKVGISDELFDQYGLVEGQPLNIGVGKNSDGDLVMPTGFDPDDITVTISSDQRSFAIDLGANKLLEDEVLHLSYTLKLNETAKASESIVNRFILEADQQEVSRGHHYWNAHQNATQGGIVSNIKSVEGIIKDGRVPDISRLVDGETLQYKVTLSNYLPRANRVVHVKNIIDYMPEYITYVEDSFKLQYKTSVLQSDGVTYEEVITDIDPSTYTLLYDETLNQIEVRFTSNYEQAGGVEGSDLNKPINSVIMSYVGLVDSTNTKFDPIDPNSSRVQVTNEAVAFYEESVEDLVAKSGVIAAKTPTSKYQDGDDDTHSTILSTSNVQVLNENNPFGWISKRVSDNSAIDVLSDDDVNREYEVTVFNTAFKNFGVTHIVDLLPEYETIDPIKGITVVDNTDGSEYEAIYSLDSVVINGFTYNRVIVTGYVKNGVDVDLKLEAITLPGQNNSMTVVYTTTIDKEQARKDLYLSDSYRKNVRNNVAMYTDEEIVLFAPQGVNVSSAYKRLDDAIEETDWDSDITTSIRYETGVSASIYSPAIVPYMDVRAQIVEVSGTSGVTYRNALDTDFINPGDVVGWKVRIGNSNSEHTPDIKAGSTIVLEVPDGLKFDGYSTNDAPSFLEEVQVNDQDRILIWKTTTDIPKGTSLQFIIRTTTRSAFYEVYTVDGYFVPHEVPEYGFFNSKVYNSNEYRSYNSSERRRNYLYEPNYGELPTEFKVGNEKYHYVTGSESAHVLGNLSIGGRLEVQSNVESNKKATTTTAPYFIQLQDVEDTVRFSMYMDVYKVGAGVKDIVMINRLAGENDRFIVRDQDRRSQGSLKLVDDGNFTVSKVNATSGSLIETVDESLYSVQYAVVDYDYDFTDVEWDITTPSIWMTAQELIAAGYDFNDVTATRTILDNSVSLDMNEAIKVSFDSHLEGYHNPTWEAYTSYAYGATVDGSTKVNAETRSLGIKSKVFEDRLKLVTEVDDPALTPLRTDFEVSIVAYDKQTDQEVARVDELITVQNINGVLENTSWFEALNRSHYFKIEAKHYDGFRIPEVEVTPITDQYGLTVYEAFVRYERIVYDEIEVKAQIETIDNKYKIANVPYRLEEYDAQNNTVGSEDRIIGLTNQQGIDIITTYETGSTFGIDADMVDHYNYKIEFLGTEDLDTTGVKHKYMITYTQVKDDEDTDGNGKKDPSTGLQDKTFIYVGILAVAVVGAIILVTKRKKNDK